MDELIETTEIIEPEQEQEPDKKPKKKENSLWSWVKCILFAVVLAWVITHVVIVNAEVPTGSMIDTIMPKDRIVAFRLAYLVAGPQRGDIVIFKHKAEPGRDQTRLVKRVIGLPGETVDIRDNRIYINGSETPLEEPYLPEPMETDDRHFEVPEGCYLMLGDNRNHSADARRWSDPYVPKEEILAKVLIKYFPGIKKIR